MASKKRRAAGATARSQRASVKDAKNVRSFSIRKVLAALLFVVAVGVLATTANEWSSVLRAINSTLTDTFSQSSNETAAPAALAQNNFATGRTAAKPSTIPRNLVRASPLIRDLRPPLGKASLLNGDEQPFGFAGYVKDPEAGLYYAKARYYDPAVGRFTNEDPFAGNDLEPPSLHRYLYAYANPTTYVDPTGRASLESQRLAYQQSIDFAPSPEARATAEGVMREYELQRREVGVSAAKSLAFNTGLTVGGAYIASAVALGRTMYATYAAYGARTALIDHGVAAAATATIGAEAAAGIATGAMVPSALPEALPAAVASAEVRAARVGIRPSLADSMAENTHTTMVVREADSGGPMLVPAGPAAARSSTSSRTPLLPAEVEALEGTGMDLAQVDDYMETLGDAYLFRGTTPDYPGSPARADSGFTPTSIDPLVATVYGLASHTQSGNGVVQYGSRTQIGAPLEVATFAVFWSEKLHIRVRLPHLKMLRHFLYLRRPPGAY